ncbi:glycosyltransferase [Arcobacter arenosus]|uniref:Glycosyltransferase n=1 Tax=Arcobacter arenosus TaxID=2576037 RepID=A0A5R8XZ42_9BACT|nr:glycosyltransferase [Arcobacter arenosus]TLP36820.1 glycosyltransferase [Arcobacter arenosus]
MRTILITNIPTPYRIPLWDKIKTSISFETICIAKIEKNRLWKIEKRDYISFLKSYHFFISKMDWPIHFTIPFSLFFKLLKENPNNLIITGYDSLAYWEALLYAKLFRKKTILWNGSTLLSSRSKNKIVNLLKKVFINSFDTFYTYGTEATKYLEHFGIQNKNIITGTNCVDTDYFKNNTPYTKQNSNSLNFLYVGQLIERKGLENTIKAFSKIKKTNWKLSIIGKGEDEDKLKKLVNDLSLRDKITFEGFKQKDEIIDYYSKADIFLMPSYLEVWGLVLNEALASGLFCLSSKYAGASIDLIHENKNGFTIDPLDINDLIKKIDQTFELNIDKEKIKESFTINYENEAKKIINAINKAYK